MPLQLQDTDDLDDLMEEMLREAPRASVRSAAPAQQAARRLLTADEELWATATLPSKDVPLESQELEQWQEATEILAKII